MAARAFSKGYWHEATDLVARMIPSRPAHRDSSAEASMFERFSRLPDSWTVLHSLGLVRHAHKPWAEIDFTLVGPLGVFLVEVKGGLVSRAEGQWTSRTAGGTVESLGAGPFHQVGGAEAAMRSYLQDHIPELRHVTFGYLVATPDCRLEVDDLGVNSMCIYDASDAFTAPLEVLARLHEHWSRRMGRTLGLDEGMHQLVLERLCGDISAAADLRHTVADVEHGMALLTAEQERAVAEMADSQRLWLAGSAGAGKTMLAVSEARRASTAGQRVLFCCHTSALAWAMQGLLGAYPGVTVAHRQQLVDQNMWRNEQFDLLIVDEAQDLMDADFVGIANKLLVGGISEGSWRVFIDQNQALFADVDQAIVQLWLDARPAIQRLSRNCRSTKPISLTVSALTGVPLASGGIENAPVPVIVSIDPGAEVADVVSERVARLLEQGLDERDVLVLTPQRLESSCLASAEARFTDFREPVPGRIRHARIGAYEGLEARAVILVGIDDLDSAWIRQQVYVGATRATVFLEVLVSPSLRGRVAAGYATVALGHGQ